MSFYYHIFRREQVQKEQDKLRDSVNSNDSEGHSIRLQLEESVFLNNCVLESARFCAPFLSTKVAVKDLNFSGYKIPKGSIVAVSPFLQRVKRRGEKVAITLMYPIETTLNPPFSISLTLKTGRTHSQKWIQILE